MPASASWEVFSQPPLVISEVAMSLAWPYSSALLCARVP